jgi:glycosyltransferase involved in cell wall biosynthesis
VTQKTNFAYEVLINDDQSTDGTAAIIREYEEKYPHIIKAVYQTENQYSQGVPIIMQILVPLSSGKYFALCEGDDWWTDPNKLQKQYDYMQAHPECCICAHNAIFHNVSEGKDTTFPACSEDKDYTVDEVIRGGGGLFSTNSLFMRREIYLDRPGCFSVPGVGDYQLVVFGAISGTCHYMADTMSLYNYNTPGSWTSRTLFDNEKRVAHYQNMIHMLSAVDEYYDRKYTDPIQDVITDYEFSILKGTGDRKSMKARKYASRYKTYRRQRSRYALYTFIEKRFPALITLYHKLSHSED